jgi:prephenate dehydrogenase
MPPHLISRVSVLGTGLIGGSFALALRKYCTDLHISGWDRAEIARDAQSRGIVDEGFYGPVAEAIGKADLIYLALPIGVTIALLPEIARYAPAHALVTDACSTKARVLDAAGEHLGALGGPLFLGGHPMTGKEVSGLANAEADLFRNSTYALIDPVGARIAPPDVPGATRLSSSSEDEPSAPIASRSDARIHAFLKLLEKIGARPLWLGAQQHDYAVGLVSHLPQLAAVALASFLYDHLDENGLPITLAGPGLRDSLRIAGSPYSTWRDIVLTNKEFLSASLDLFARRLDDLREKLASRDLEADFDASNELYKLLRSL